MVNCKLYERTWDDRLLLILNPNLQITALKQHQGHIGNLQLQNLLVTKVIPCISGQH